MPPVNFEVVPVVISTLGHNFFSFNAMAMKLWKSLQLSFSNYMMEFDATGKN